MRVSSHLETGRRWSRPSPHKPHARHARCQPTVRSGIRSSIPTRRLIQKADMQRPLRFIAWLQVVSTLALSLPAGAAEQPPKAQDVVTEEAKQWASAAADAYHDTHLKPAERLENAEAKLHAAQKHCGTSKDCVNLLYFGLGCVYEDQHKLLRQKSVALQAQGKTAEALQLYALAERRLLAAHNAYERFTSQREQLFYR